MIIDSVSKTTFAGNLEAAALRGTVVIYGAASGLADPIVPNSLMARSLTVAGGSLGNYMRTSEEMLDRANDVIKGIEEGWLKLHIHAVIPLADAAKAHRLLEGRHRMGKVVLSVA